MHRGKIFNIQHYAIHDGPGIRTTVFFKGCPLNCVWCHNPESINKENQIFYRREKCIACLDCVNHCLREALIMTKDGLRRDQELCNLCGECSEICPTLALELVGQEYNLAEIMGEILKDRLFYEESGGGVTFSGGEPLGQAEFLISLLQECQANGLHCAVDTCGYAPWKIIEQVAACTDLFLYDLKHLDPLKHKKYTGVSNRLIIDNLKKLRQIHENIWIRLPLIPGFNDESANIQALGEFLVTLNLERIYLLPYHQVAVGKHRLLGQTDMMPSLAAPTKEKEKEIKEKLDSFGLRVRIGG